MLGAEASDPRNRIHKDWEEAQERHNYDFGCETEAKPNYEEWRQGKAISE